MYNEINMGEFLGFDCEHILNYHPNPETIFLDPVVQIDGAETKADVVVGMVGKCLASKGLGGECGHDCRKVHITHRRWVINFFSPDQPVRNGQVCTTEKVV